MEVSETKVRVPLLYWIPLLICGAMLFYIDIFDMDFTLKMKNSVLKSDDFEERSFAGFAINTPGCKIPAMDPFDQHIIKFIKNLSKPICNNGKPSLVASNLTSIYLINSSFPSYNVTDLNNLRCCYTPFWRIDPKNGQDDNKIQFSTECNDFQSSADITDEFIKVTCSIDNNTIYTDTFSFVPLKNKSQIKPDPKKLNVLVVGLDGVSRLNLLRQMSKTVAYLQEQDAVELLGYNKVDDNTFPNLIPVLTGLSENELKNNCWPTQKHYFDDCPFIWKVYRNRSHLTVFGEDSSWMGIFNYQRNGFLKQTTDYAYNYFNRKTEELIGNNHVLNVKYCAGSRLVYKDLLDYITKFVETMSTHKAPYFGFFWGASLTHDFLNMAKTGDDDYYTFFKKLVEDQMLNNTVLIFMSDHGIRWGDIRQTFQGRMEERLPFIYILLPTNFKINYNIAYRNLKQNTRRLTTPFDLHETLLNLANPKSLLNEDNLNVNQSNRGISFFKRISKYRTCEDAGIESHWCTCQKSIEINITSDVIAAGKAAVDNINVNLKGYAQCAELSLDEIKSARKMISKVTGSNEFSDYMLTLTTLPGKAIFEVTVRNRYENDFEIIGSISRLNLYGKQSSCITDFHLKLYCYCKSLL